MAQTEFWGEHAIQGLIFSAILLIGVFSLRAVLLRLIRGKLDVLTAERRRFLMITKNTALVLAVFGLAIIWSPELTTIALSLTAIAVAIVIATKELILCLFGGLLRASSKSFVIGDWIEIDGLRGEVVDYSLFTTTLHEIGMAESAFAYTGRTITVPNGRLITHSLSNENIRRRYVFHSFHVTFDPGVATPAVREKIAELVAAEWARFAEVGRRYHGVLRRELGVDLPPPEPVVITATTELGKVQMRVRLFCPTDQAISIERRVSAAAIDFALAGGPALENGSGDPGD